ncbi:hypothetical protein [Vibrio palustris]|uniref:Uncharacterized protein n=1 Tax=Vibrio palustris TaxID=1918946 RepID=A0A1R4B2E5_9VIBR|nr:hypothetical protein [Vibrio palustris]SJL83085.1 hypothetical protein VPAL9027_01034 [Vibrio palustris]
MIRLIAIAVLLVLAFVLVRYGTNAHLQKSVVITVGVGLFLYIASVVIVELLH